MTGGRAGQASEAAVEAAARARGGGNTLPDVLAAAHDPALGLDRSVRLGDVVEALRAYDPAEGEASDGGVIAAYEDFDTDQAADFIERNLPAPHRRFEVRTPDLMTGRCFHCGQRRPAHDDDTLACPPEREFAAPPERERKA